MEHAANKKKNNIYHISICANGAVVLV